MENKTLQGGRDANQDHWSEIDEWWPEREGPEGKKPLRFLFQLDCFDLGKDSPDTEMKVDEDGHSLYGTNQWEPRRLGEVPVRLHILAGTPRETGLAMLEKAKRWLERDWESLITKEAQTRNSPEPEEEAVNPEKYQIERVLEKLGHVNALVYSVTQLLPLAVQQINKSGKLHAGAGALLTEVEITVNESRYRLQSLLPERK